MYLVKVNRENVGEYTDKLIFDAGPLGIVEKIVSVSGPLHAEDSDRRLEEMAYLCALKIREASKDFAYRAFGNKWRKMSKLFYFCGIGRI